MKQRTMLTVAIIGMWASFGLWRALPAYSVASINGAASGAIAINPVAMSDHEVIVGETTVWFSDHFFDTMDIDDEDECELQIIDDCIRHVIRRSINILGTFRTQTLVLCSVEDFRSTTYAACASGMTSETPAKLYWDQAEGVAYIIANARPIPGPLLGTMIATTGLGYSRVLKWPLPSVLHQAIIGMIAADRPVDGLALRADPRGRQFLGSPAFATIGGQLTDGISGYQIVAANVALDQLWRVSPSAIATLVREYADRHWRYYQCLERLDQFARAAGLSVRIGEWTSTYGCFQVPQEGVWAFNPCDPAGVDQNLVCIVARDADGRLPAFSARFVDACRVSNPPLDVPSGAVAGIKVETFRRECEAADWVIIKGMIGRRTYTTQAIFPP
ncbi:hypothetical protein HZA86_05560 [Candidatus Uhrbacteria bacterium]|nr:hypothetical protein [Candidatus Uhrbacteria bacterium]